MHKKVLIVAAHPDDEALGCGGTMARHAENGDEVHVVFMADGVTSRPGQEGTEELEERHKVAQKACGTLGVQSTRFLGFPDNQMDSVVLLKIVQELETVMSGIQPSIVYTHFANDLNIDHRITHQAVMTACRPQPGSSVREIYSFEVLSSTEWGTPSSENSFIPNCYVDISATINKKLSALSCYKTEMRPFPHSRSIEAVEHLAGFRGTSVGMTHAEAFRVERLLK